VTQIVSWSELSDARQCPMKHKKAYRERWQTTPTGTDALSKGSCYHSVMDVHFSALKATQGEYYNPAQDSDRLEYAVSAAQQRIDEMRQDREYPEETIELVEWMYVGYVEMYGIDRDWRILAVETTHHVPFYEPIGNTGEWQRVDDFELKIKIDVAVTDQRDRLWIVDHKSAGKMPGSEKDFQWADQFGLYHYGYRELGYKVCGTIHNAALSKPNKGDLLSEGDPGWKSTMKAHTLESRFVRTFMDRTDHELRVIQWEALQTFRNIYGAKTTPRHPDEERCRWKCSFADACNMSRRNGEHLFDEYLVDTGFTQDFRRN